MSEDEDVDEDEEMLSESDDSDSEEEDNYYDIQKPSHYRHKAIPEHDFLANYHKKNQRTASNHEPVAPLPNNEEPI